MADIHELNVSQIFLDHKNPRHDSTVSQRDLISAMIEDQGSKLVRLGEDILKNGLNPADLPIVIPHNPDSDKFTVVEGNRRLIALKLLTNPVLCSNTSLYKSFNDLSKNFQKKPITKLDCVVMSSREKARHWIQLKHTDENRGIGIVKWSATAKRRFEAQDSTPSIQLQVRDYIMSSGNLDSETEKLFQAINTSTIQRLIGDPDVRKFLGLEVKNGLVHTKFSNAETARVLREFLTPFATGEKKVGAVYSKDNRLDYLRKLDRSVLPIQGQSTSKSWPLNAPPKQEIPASKPSLGKQSGNKAKPISQNRKHLIPREFSVTIGYKRINSIYRELRDNISVQDTPNAAAVLLRVFLEVSIDVFLKKNNISVYENDKLSNKITKVANYFKDNNIMSIEELKPVNTAISSPHSLFSTNTLNAYVHNPDMQPIPSELNTTWDNMELFIKKIWK